MYGGNINYGINFQGNTEQLKTQLNDLKTMLNNISTTPVSIGSKLTPEIQKASVAAAELKTHLDKATSVQTGKLDFSKLNSSLKSAGMSLSQYGAQLQKLGPQGQQAFQQLATAVAAAEIPIRRASGMLAKFGTTLMNTVKWQISSSMINGFIRGVRDAYNYSKDLNESLNSIRIVTGKSVDEMATFANEANKAAKQLSTTTNEYAKASLIFFQQGLNSSEVKNRTDITIKMANVTKQSAEVVSDQLTAIWNNFATGSESLESFADKITALGAATATSTDEIAGGLEKFAGIAKTIGLSYDYAAAALATITANTRQSEEVVGTALKTIFSRIEGLKLGETLEDGTDLNKYSQALKTIGVDIMDSMGQLKDADTILADMGERWKDLSRAEKVATAQAVGGIRQYNQLISLMDNWDSGDKDSFQANLDTIAGSAGTLQDQADIYAESWAAASKRVKAAAESMYSSLFDDKFFIKLTNGFGELVEKVDGFVKSIGGLSGVLTALGVVLTKVFADKMAQSFRNMADNLKMSSQVGQRMVDQQKAAQLASMRNTIAQNSTPGMVGTAQTNATMNQIKAQEMVASRASQLNDIQKSVADTLVRQIQLHGEVSVQLTKEYDQVKRIANETRATTNDIIKQNAQKGMKFDASNSQIQKLANLKTAIQDAGSQGEFTTKSLKKIASAADEVGGTASGRIKALISSLKGVTVNSEEGQAALAKLGVAYNSITSKRITGLAEALVGNGDKEKIKAVTAALQELLGAEEASTSAAQKASNANRNMARSMHELDTFTKTAGQSVVDWATRLSSAINGMMNIGMMISSIKGLMDTISNPDLSGWEKLGMIFTSLSMTLMSLTGIVTAFKTVFSGLTLATTRDSIVRALNTAAMIAQEKAQRRKAAADMAEGATTDANTKKQVKNTVARGANKYASAKNPQTFTDVKTGKTRTFAGRLGKNGQYLDTNGKQISQANIDKHGLQTRQTLAPGALKTLGLKAGAAAVVIATIAATAAIVKSASDMYNAAEIEANKAANTAAGLATRYDEAKQSYENFKSTLTSYEDAKSSLDTLKEGTIEFEEAINNANEAALKLINTYEDIKYTVGKDGLIEIDQESLAEAQQKEFQQMKAMRQASVSSQMYADETALRAKEVQFNREIADDNSFYGTSKEDQSALAGGVGGGATMAAGAVGYTALSAGTTAVIGAGATQAWNPVGWAMLAVGAIMALTGVIMAATNEDETSEEQKALELLEEQYHLRGEEALTKRSIELTLGPDGAGMSADLIESLTENRDETAELVREMADNTDAVRQQTQQMLMEEYGDAGAFMVGDYQTKASAIGKQLEDLNDDINRLEDFDRYAEDPNEFTQLMLRYEAAIGKELRYADNEVRGGDDDRTVHLLDENGNEMEGIPIEQIIEVVKTYEATEDISTEVKKIENTILNSLSKQGDGVYNALMSFATNEQFGEDLTQNDFENIQSADKNGNGLSDLEIEEYLKETYGVGAEKLAEVWDTTADQIYKNFKDASEKTTNEFNSVLEDLREAGATFNPEVWGNLSLKQQKLFGEAFSNAEFIGGEEQVNSLAGVFNELTEKELKAFADGVEDIDWNTVTIDDLSKKMVELGLQTKISNGDLGLFINTMKKTENTLDGIQQDAANIYGVASKINNVAGTSITAEEYNKTIAFNSDYMKYFVPDGKGGMSFLGGVNFSEIVNEDVRKQYQETAKDSYSVFLSEKDFDERFKKVSDANDYQNKYGFSYGASEGDILDSFIHDPKAMFGGAGEGDPLYSPKGYVIYENTAKGQYERSNPKDDNSASAAYMATIKDENGNVIEKVETDDSFGGAGKLGGRDGNLTTTVFYDVLNPNKEEINQQRVAPPSEGTSETNAMDALNKRMAMWGSDFELKPGYTIEFKQQSGGEQLVSGVVGENGQIDTWTDEDGNTGDTFRLFKSDVVLYKDIGFTYRDDIDQLQKQLDIMKDLGTITDAEHADYSAKLEKDKYISGDGKSKILALTKEDLEYIDTKWIDDTRKAMADSAAQVNKAYNDWSQATQHIAATVSTLEELNDLYELSPEDGGISAEAYDSRAYQLDMQREYKDFSVEEAQEYGKYLSEVATASSEVSDQLTENEELSQQVAIAMMRMNKGVSALSENWEEWSDVLSNSTIGSQEHYEALTGLKTAMADLLGISEDSLSSEFLTNAHNMQLMSQAAQGSAEAIDELAFLAAKDYVISLDLKDAEGNSLEDDLLGFMDKWKDYVFSMEIGAHIDDANFQAELAKIMENSQMTVAQFEEWLNAMQLEYDGVLPEKLTETVVESETPVMRNVVINGSPGEEGISSSYYNSEGENVDLGAENIASVQYSYAEQVGTKPLKASVLSFEEVDVTRVKRKSSGSMNNSSSINKGGGTSSKSAPKKVTKTKRSDVVQRYKEINDKLDDIADAADRANKAQDRLYGKARISAMKENTKLMKEEIGLLKDKRKEAENYLKEDLDNLSAAASEVGVQLNIDSNGNISNYSDAMDHLYKQLADAEQVKAGLGTSEEQDDYQSSTIDPINDAIDLIQKEIDAYDETRELIDDLDADIEDAIYAWQDQNLEILQAEIEFQIKINDAELKKLNYYLDKYQDDIYTRAEGATYLGQRLGKNLEISKQLQQEFAQATLDYNTIDPETGKRKLSDAGYAELLEDIRSRAYENLEDIQVDQDDLFAYYGDTVRMASEELDSWVARMNHSLELYDHFKNVLELTGAEKNRDQIGQVLDAQVDAAENDFRVATERRDAMKQQSEYWEQKWREAVANGDEHMAELYKENWMSSEEEYRALELSALEKTEALIEKIKLAAEHKLKDVAKVWEEALTGGISFDQLNTEMERLESLQEEYLTTTNKIYETNKLINKAQQEIDKTTNNVSKRKLKAFQQETTQLQNQGQLSEFELDIQQKKYDLLLAEIALEEAQNAKSVVRLQRDSEGNFGYVYTADQDEVNSAQQDYDDAENELYNVQLDGANKYASQRVQILQEMHDTMTSLTEQYHNGEFASYEEYHQRMQEAEKYYYALLEQNSSLYKIATTNDSRVVRDAWSSNLSIMDTSVNTFQTHTEDYLAKVRNVLDITNSKIESVTETSGYNFDNLTQDIYETKRENEKYAKHIQERVLPEMKNQMTQAGYTATSFWGLYSSINGTIGAQEDLVDQIDITLDWLSDLDTDLDGIKTSADNAAVAIGELGRIQSEVFGDGSYTGYNPITPQMNDVLKTFDSGTLKISKNAKPEIGTDGRKKIIGYINGTPHIIDVDASTYTPFIGPPSKADVGYLLYNIDNVVTTKFDTGGYTGEWGSAGKLATLHEKELVLDKTDTENFLLSLNILHDIIKLIDLNSANSMLKQAQIPNGKGINNSVENFEQTVTIEANFPNVNSKQEIEEALYTLINDANQYMNRKSGK